MIAVTALLLAHVVSFSTDQLIAFGTKSPNASRSQGLALVAKALFDQVNGGAATRYNINSPSAIHPRLKSRQISSVHRFSKWSWTKEILWDLSLKWISNIWLVIFYESPACITCTVYNLIHSIVTSQFYSTCSYGYQYCPRTWVIASLTCLLPYFSWWTLSLFFFIHYRKRVKCIATRRLLHELRGIHTLRFPYIDPIRYIHQRMLTIPRTPIYLHSDQCIFLYVQNIWT